MFCRSMGCKLFAGADLVKLLERAEKAPDHAPVFLAEPNAARFGRLAQCRVQGRPVFGDVDDAAGRLRLLGRGAHGRAQ